MLKVLKNKNTIISLFILLSTFTPLGLVFANTQCGSTDHQQVNTTIDLGCSTTGNPISDLFFAIVRLLADGVGLIIVGSTIFAGIQFATARDNPEAAQKARGRIQSNIFALIMYLFAFALINFLVPGGFFA
jgi:hypothetical protein